MKNCENFVENAIKSIAEQNFPNELMEIILVDDSSTDKTLAVIENQIRKMKVMTKVIRQEWKRGLGVARNTVVNNLTGKYIACAYRDVLELGGVLY